MRHSRFIDFVTTKPLEGLGTDVEMLKRICPGQVEVLDLILQATQGKHGGDHGNQYTAGKFDNIKLATEPQTGTNRTYALRRLRKDRPDLHKKVIAGKFTPWVIPCAMLRGDWLEGSTHCLGNR